MPQDQSAEWHEETDVLIVGLGGAGVCAAIEACEQGSAVTVLERFSGGGATAISGGVVYAGGGTDIQTQAGVMGDVAAMHAYLAQETEGVISEETLRDFCEESAPNLQWLTRLGLQFEASLCPYKTSYPNDDYFLYYSGNESADPYRQLARPAPRGHRVKGKGLPGRNFFSPLHDHLKTLDARIRFHCQVTQLIRDEKNNVTGVSFQEVPSGLWAGLHGGIEAWATKFSLFLPSVARGLRRWGAKIESRHARPKRIRARQGVILSTGGFINNPGMMKTHAPEYRLSVPLGTAGCSGEGIQMGQSIGAQTRHMDNISGWLFLNPPNAFMHGLLIDRQGRRFVNESLYGAVIGSALIEKAGGLGCLIIDAKLKAKARTQIGRGQTQTFQTVPGLLNLLFNSRKANDLESLARACGCDINPLRETLAEYNEAIRTGAADAFGKEERSPLSPPYYVIQCSPGQWTWPIMTLTLGGLSVDEKTGAVLDEKAQPIGGLYAAGRAAVGICSGNYVSGLSIADCVYSGRRAGRMASSQAK